MNDYSEIKKALDLAREKHSRQYDRSGDDYIFHPIMVALQCDSTDAKIVALLHDVIEDTDTTKEELLQKGFSPEVVDAVTLLSHDKSISYEDYVRRIKESGNRIAVEVKLADLTMNMDTGRLNGKKPPKYELYKWAYEFLTQD